MTPEQAAELARLSTENPVIDEFAIAVREAVNRLSRHSNPGSRFQKCKATDMMVESGPRLGAGGQAWPVWRRKLKLSK